MTCRGLYRLEFKNGRSAFLKWYYSTEGTFLYSPNLCGPLSDTKLAKVWGPMNYLKSQEYYFAFSSIEQMEACFGPYHSWPEEMKNNIREVLCLPTDVIDGEFQCVFHKESVLN